MTPEPVSLGEVTLRPWRPDEAEVYAGLRDELVLAFTTESATLGAEGCRANLVAALADPNHAPFAICGPDGHPAGNLAVVRRDDTAHLSYWLGPRARGRGWAASALRAGTRWAFDRWPVGQAELEIDLENEASMRVAEAAGYARRGTRLTSACGGPAAIYRLEDERIDGRPSTDFRSESSVWRAAPALSARPLICRPIILPLVYDRENLGRSVLGDLSS